MALGIRSPRVKLKSCCECKVKFEPGSGFDKTCSFECKVSYGIKLANKSKAKREQAERIQQQVDRKIIKQKLLDMEPKTYWWKRAKKAFNAWVRGRDEGKECISCDTILVKLGRVGGDYDAGHRRSVGSAKHLEFDERNVHGQCKYCNDRLAGNPDGYNAKLPSRIGQSEFDALLCDQAPRNLTADDYKKIESTYKQKLKDLKGSL